MYIGLILYYINVKESLILGKLTWKFSIIHLQNRVVKSNKKDLATFLLEIGADVMPL